MTDHARWLDLAAAEPAFGSAPDDAAALDAHLAGCRACADRVAAFRRDSARIGALDAGPVSDRVWARVEAALAAPRPRTSPLLAFAILALLALGVTGAAIGVGAYLQQVERQPPLLGTKPIQWRTDIVTLQAEGLLIEAGGRRFTGSGAAEVTGDPGDRTYWTLEVTWRELGMEQRVFLYFGADATHWWIDEVRVYDAANDPNADWASLPRGPHARTPLGMPWEGDLVLTGTGREGDVRVALTGIALAVVPGGGAAGAPPPGRFLAGEEANPFRPGGELECSGILQLAPQEAERVLRGLGYGLSWRYERRLEGNEGESEVRDEAPDRGWISRTAVGSNGELIVFVQDPDQPLIPQPPELPAHCPIPADTPHPG